jgi:hypothetical protein
MGNIMIGLSMRVDSAGQEETCCKDPSEEPQA